MEQRADLWGMSSSSLLGQVLETEALTLTPSALHAVTIWNTDNQKS